MKWRRIVVGILWGLPLQAQAPDEAWRTIRTAHLRVHFPAGLDSLARRAAGEAERAYAALAKDLVPPRGEIDIVVTDHQDLSNGSATPFPTNRIVILARPPVDEPALRVGDDWLRFLVTHEMAHIFHLERSRGWWRLAQRVFGRHPVLFPHTQSPRWLTEGIAMQYEGQAGAGRLDGTFLHATLGALDAHGRRPAPGSASLATPWFPAGNVAYFGGARIVAAGVAAGGDTALRAYIERVAVQPLPYLWDHAARRSFGASFGELARRAAAPETAAAAPLRERSAPFWDARAPRWSGDTIWFVASAPRAIPALWAATEQEARRMSRRNSVDAHGRAGERTAHAELDFGDPYRLRSYLYIDGRRVAGSARLASPDVRADGRVVAVETVPGATRLVLLSADGRERRVLTEGSPDVHWSAPRWSRAGDRVAAIRWERGGVSSVVVLDTAGRVVADVARARALQSHPSWDADDRAVYFTSDRSGRAAIYRASLAGAGIELMATAPGGLFDGEVSPDGRTIAAFALGAEGLTLVTVPVPDAPPGPVAVVPQAGIDLGPVLQGGGAASRYSPWRSVLPRYWIPSGASSTRGDALAGFFTTGRDVTGRHEVGAQGLWDLRTGEFSGDVSWRYSGFGVPVLAVAVSQSWDAFRLADTSGSTLGELARRNRVAALTGTWVRPRVRTSAYITAGVEFEWRDFMTDPPGLLAQLSPLVHGTLTYPAGVLAAGWNNLQRSTLALSAEDGVSLSMIARRRWRTDAPSATTANSYLGDVRLYRSLPFPGHARHVVAVRGVGGWGDRQLARPFSIGGVSGSSLEVLPGFQIGDARRAFGVRGFAPGTMTGVRAWATSAEYRAPLAVIGRGAWPLPFFLQRSAVAFFGDAASAWCPAGAQSAGCPAGGTARTTIASAGAELLFDMAVDYDTPTRFRFGGALPVTGGGQGVQGYLSLGVQF